MPHAISFDGKVYGPNGPIRDTTGTPLATADVDAYNAALTAQELAHWQTAPDTFSPAYFAFPAEHAGPGKPYRAAFAPVRTDATVTTFTGALLGHIVTAKVYPHNFGGRMVSLTVRGTNGATYYGRASWGHGSVVRLRRAKGAK